MKNLNFRKILWTTVAGVTAILSFFEAWVFVHTVHKDWWPSSWGWLFYSRVSATPPWFYLLMSGVYAYWTVWAWRRREKR